MLTGLKLKSSMLLLAFVVLISALSISPAYADKKASLVIDANSGKVLHAENASEIRYPASLTKLMTLYMTFDALRTGKLKMDTKLTASKKAAGMPSTNLRLKAGDTILVRDAIQALVVRSANDVAVILAESISGSEYKFATLMTAVANRLGMKNTTFKNASGLPDRQQKTTARDMAVLALALRRHYPEYYPYFKTQIFSYKGKNYTSHNRVMKRISGADGLKTGYINASGFNLVTSAQRKDKSIVGVVLGGDSSKQRDDKMVDLIERTFKKMNLQTNRRQFVLNEDPKPTSKPLELQQLALRTRQNSLYTLQSDSSNSAAAGALSKAFDAVQKPADAPFEPYEFAMNDTIPNAPQFDPPAASKPLNQNAMIRTTTVQPLKLPAIKNDNFEQFSPQAFTNNVSKNWGVQVGAYTQSSEAKNAAANAANRVPELLQNARVTIQDKREGEGQVLYRARLADITEHQAKRACQLLVQSKTPCFVYQEKNKS